MKRVLLAVVLTLVFSAAARANASPTQAAPAELAKALKLVGELKSELSVLRPEPIPPTHAMEPTMYEAPTELTRVSAVVDPSPHAPLTGDVGGPLTPQTGGGGHSTALTWILSVDDTTTACTTTANCLQNVYRASGTCSTSSSFSLLTTTALISTATAFTDSTVTPGVWCYGVTFGINGLESAKDTVSVTLQPASPSGLAGAPK